MRFEWPLGLGALVLVPLTALGFVALERRRARYAVHFTNLDVLASVAGRPTRWTRVPAILVLLALTCATAALARPAVETTAMSERASIVLAVDTSGSMAADDVKPSRLIAAQDAIARFIARLPARYRVGLVTFSARPAVAAPLSWDRDEVSEMLDLARPAQGTAIGDAIARSADLLEPLSANDSTTSISAASPPLSAILLLSDGAQTGGRLGALQGAALARSRGIPVYTVALGTPDGTISEGVITLKVPPDSTTLRKIADATGGTFFAPTDEASLRAVYEHLASSLGRRTAWRELGFVLSGLAAALALVAGALSLFVHARLP
jgi:Ca-activated chloride channel family protein